MSEKEEIIEEIKEKIELPIIDVEIPEIPEIEPIPQIIAPIQNIGTPNHKKAFIEIADGICKDAESFSSLEEGKCEIPLKKLKDEEINLQEYVKEVKKLLPDEQKIAFNALIEVGVDKGLNVKNDG